jgi:hypothetical protein
MKLGLFILILMQFKFATAGTISILTDQPDGSAAKELIELIKITPPFSRIKDLKINLIQQEVSCKKITGIALTEQKKANTLPESCKTNSGKKEAEKSLARAPGCENYSELAKIQAETQSDFLIFIKNDPRSGGASGAFTVITSGTPSVIGIHELLHRMGFGDEYPFATTCEADIFCSPRFKWVNIAMFKDNPPYSSDSSARQQHNKNIPWFSKILPNTLITTGDQLGTSKPNVIGLYPAQTCFKNTQNIKAWRPGDYGTVMGEGLTTYIPQNFWDQIATALHSKIGSPNPKEALYYYRRKGDTFEKILISTAVVPPSASATIPKAAK